MATEVESPSIIRGIVPWKKPSILQSKSKTGVYVIIHASSGRRYIGSSSRSISQRWSEHKNALRNKTHGNQLLQRAWDKYGESEFEFTVLEHCSPEWCLVIEQIYINKFRPSLRENGFNLAPNVWSALGVKRSDEFKRNLSESRLGVKRPAWVVKKILPTLIKNAANPVTQEKMSAWKRRHWQQMTADEKAAKLAALSSPSARAKMSASRTGKKRSEEAKRKTSASLFAYHARKKGII